MLKYLNAKIIFVGCNSNYDDKLKKVLTMPHLHDRRQLQFWTGNQAT
jgi:hypothetical protein